MGKYVVALYCDLCKHSDAWNQIRRDQMAGLTGEYKALAEELATRYGSFHGNFVGDGHLFLFENADAAVQFGLGLIRAWQDGFTASRALQGLPPIQLRVGAHFGESTQIGDGEAWVGRVNNVANRIETAADPDTVLVSEGMLDLIDFPLYQIHPVEPCALRGDCVARRVLYRVDSFDEAASAAKPPHELTAEDWFLRGVAMIGTAKENTDEEEACYVEALRLRPEYAEVHYNYATLLWAGGNRKAAEEHLAEALRLRPDHADTHNNYANVLLERGDVEGAEKHYMEALRLCPDLPEAHYNYANVMAKTGDMERAEEHYLEALRWRPDHVGAHNNYANVLLARGDVEGAEKHYLEALRLCPDDAQVYYNYADLLGNKGDVERAERHYRRAYELDPSEPDIRSAFERRAWER